MDHWMMYRNVVSEFRTIDNAIPLGKTVVDVGLDLS
jgi:hypothetical protein